MFVEKQKFFIKEFVTFLITLTKKKFLIWEKLQDTKYLSYYAPLEIKNKLYKIFVFQTSFDQYCIQIQYQFTEITKQIGPTFRAEYQYIKPLLHLLLPDTEEYNFTDLKEVEDYLNRIQQEFYDDQQQPNTM